MAVEESRPFSAFGEHRKNCDALLEKIGNFYSTLPAKEELADLRAATIRIQGLVMRMQEDKSHYCWIENCSMLSEQIEKFIVHGRIAGLRQETDEIAGLAAQITELSTHQFGPSPSRRGK